MAEELKDVSVAVLAVDGFEQAELLEPCKADYGGGRPRGDCVQHPGAHPGLQAHGQGETVKVDLTFADADAEPENFDAVMLPGGVVNADEIRRHPKAQDFVRRMDAAGKPVGVICHGPWLLVSAGLTRGRTLTSWPSLQDDLRNAGATWVDKEVMVDRNWVSSRKPDDLPAFNREFLSLLAKSAHAHPA